MVVANSERLPSGYQFTIGIEEPDAAAGNHLKTHKRKYTVIHHYRHFVLVMDENDMRDTVLNVDLMAAGIIQAPYIMPARTGYRREHIPTGVDRYSKYRKM